MSNKEQSFLEKAYMRGLANIPVHTTVSPTQFTKGGNGNMDEFINHKYILSVDVNKGEDCTAITISGDTYPPNRAELIRGLQDKEIEEYLYSSAVDKSIRGFERDVNRQNGDF